MRWPDAATLTTIADVASAVCFLLAGVLALAAAIGLVRFPDLLTRMHAATKPQVVGMLLAMVGLALRIREVEVVAGLALVALFQMTTSPIASHMVGRAAFRAGQVRKDLLVVDELSEVLDREEPRGAP